MNASTQNLQARLDAVVEKHQRDGENHHGALQRLREERPVDFDEALKVLIARRVMEQSKALGAL